MEKVQRSSIPNNAFDIEYRTQWRDEVDFLASRGIYYTIRKIEGEYNIPTYKYTRTAELFLALADFYLHRLPNRKSMATYKGKPKFEQQSFLNDDGTVKKRFEVKETVKEIKQEPATEESKLENNIIDLEKIKQVQEFLKQMEEKAKTEHSDDTE